MRWIDESDIYVLLLGGRYGSIEKSSDLSYTEVEYDYAVSQKKPYFSIVITDQALDLKLKTFGKDAMENEEPKKLKEFRNKVLSNMSSFYSEKKDIKLAIHETLQDFKERYNFSGWVSGKNAVDSEVLLEENRKLRLQIEDLNKSNNSDKPISEAIISGSPATTNDQADFDDLIEVFSNMIIRTEQLTSNETMEEYRMIDIIESHKGALIAGVNNRMGMTNRQKLFFFNILPKLAIHDLAENVALQGVQYRLFRINKRGLKFLAYLDKKRYKKK